MKDIRKNPKPQKRWGVYNWGYLWSVARTRKEAIRQAEILTGEPWASLRQDCEVHKVIVAKRED